MVPLALRISDTLVVVSKCLCLETNMASFHFTITPPGSPAPVLRAPPPRLTYSFPQFFSRTPTAKDTAAALDMQRRIDTIHTTTASALASPAVLSARRSSSGDMHDDEYDPSWSTPEHYNLDRAAAIAHKIAQEELALLTPAAALHLGGTVGTPFDYEIDHKAVRFTGLYVVNGPTEVRHIRYAMEVALPELQLRTRCIQRFQSFYDLRKRLLKTTKRCCFVHHQPELSSNRTASSSTSSYQPSKFAAFRELPHVLRSSRCRACRRAHKALRAMPFPRRKLFATTANDVRARSLELETFLGACARLLVDWPGCERGRKLVAIVMGKFLGVNILQQLFPSHYGRGSGYDAITNLLDSQMEAVGRGDGGFGSEYAPSAGTTGVCSESSSSAAFYAGGPSSRTLASMRSSSSSSLSLHDDEEYFA